MTRRRRLPPALVAAVAVAAVAAAITLVRLGVPDGIVFDETYYVVDARSMLRTGVEDAFAVHPPVGKWVIAAGIALLGDTPAGWRIGGALLSVLAVAATTELGRRLTGRLRWGVAAGVLVAVDGVWLTLARLAMLDAVLAAFVTVGTLALVVDHQRATSRASDAAPAGARWPLVAAGALFGLAAATMWSGLLALGGAGLLATGWELAARRRRGEPSLAAARHTATPVLRALVVVPVVVYAATWVPWLAGYASSSTAERWCAAAEAERASGEGGCDPSLGDRVAGLARHHLDITRFHLGLEADHPYRAPATTWPAQLRPVVAHYERCDEAGTDGEGEPCLGPPGRASEVAILGNPALWWSALVLVPASAAALRRRDGAALVPLTMLAAQFVPWLVVARPVFNFYTAPLVPALALAVVVAGAELDRPARRLATTVTAVAAAFAVAGGTSLVSGSWPATITAAVLAATAGAAAGGALDARRERRAGVPEHAPPVGTATTAVVVAAAVALLVHLAPLWLAVPVEEATLRRRWWLRSWV